MLTVRGGGSVGLRDNRDPSFLEKELKSHLRSRALHVLFPQASCWGVNFPQLFSRCHPRQGLALSQPGSELGGVWEGAEVHLFTQPHSDGKVVCQAHQVNCASRCQKLEDGLAPCPGAPWPGV